MTSRTDVSLNLFNLVRYALSTRAIKNNLKFFFINRRLLKI